MDKPAFTPDTRTIADYLHALRSGAPTPGGGSAAAYAGALGASLISMVCNLTRPGGDQALASKLDELAREAIACSDRMSTCAREDEASFQRYRDAAEMPKSSDPEKTERVAMMQMALLSAAETPLATARLAILALELTRDAAEIGTKQALSDIQTAKHLLRACIAGSLETVNVNIAMIKAPFVVERLTNAVSEIDMAAVDLTKQVDHSLGKR